MSIITTKQFRENMPQVIRDLQSGKSIQLSYRHKVIGVLQPARLAILPLRRGTPEAIGRGIDALQSINVSDQVKNDPRSMKERIAALRDEDHPE